MEHQGDRILNYRRVSKKRRRCQVRRFFSLQPTTVIVACEMRRSSSLAISTTTANSDQSLTNKRLLAILNKHWIFNQSFIFDLNLFQIFCREQSLVCLAVKDSYKDWWSNLLQKQSFRITLQSVTKSRIFSIRGLILPKDCVQDFKHYLFQYNMHDISMDIMYCNWHHIYIKWSHYLGCGSHTYTPWAGHLCGIRRRGPLLNAAARKWIYRVSQI